MLAGGKCIVVILAFHSLHGAGCSSPGSSDVLADPQVVVAPLLTPLHAPVEGPGLFDFLMRLLERLEAVCLHLPEARGPVALMLREVADEFRT